MQLILVLRHTSDLAVYFGLLADIVTAAYLFHLSVDASADRRRSSLKRITWPMPTVSV